MVEIPTTKPVKNPPGMVLIPKADFQFESRGVMIEGDDGHGVDVQYAWEDHPQREHKQTMNLGPFYIDKFPVTNANYSAYLKATGYKPRDTYNWIFDHGLHKSSG